MDLEGEEEGSKSIVEDISQTILKKETKKTSNLSYESLDVNESELDTFPETKGIFSKWWSLPLHLVFVWLIPFTWKGARNVLRMKHVPKLDEQYKCGFYEKEFDVEWKKNKGKKSRMFLTLYGVFGKEFLYGIFWKMCYTVTGVIYPLFISFLLNELQPPFTKEDEEMYDVYKKILPNDLKPDTDRLHDLGFRENDYMIWVWCFLIFLFQTISFIVSNYSYYICVRVGTKMRLILTKKIYDKAFETRNVNKGDVLNYLATDCYIIDTSHILINDVFSGVLFVLFSFIVMLFVMGTPALASYGYVCFSFLMIFLINSIIYLQRFGYFKVVDERVGYLKESVTNMLNLKFFSLEKLYLDKILKKRRIELIKLRFLLFFQAINNSLAYTTPPMMGFVGFMVYVAINGELDLVIAFTALTYFTMCRNPTAALSYQLVTYFNALSSMKRIQRFLEKKNIRITAPQKMPDDEDHAIRVTNGEFSYKPIKIGIVKKGVLKEKELEENEFKLKNIQAKIKKGELVMCVGDTRSGKSMFFKSLLNETYKSVNTDIMINGDISYVSQDPWTINDTILENIIVGTEADEDRLQKILSICALNDDIKKFEGGVHLEIGEHGSTISGGQRSRIALARACYFDKDIYLLDNILSSLDSFVSNHIFQYCILKYLSEKTRVLITNKMEFFPYADKIIFFENGEIEETGTYAELVEKKGKFFNLLNGHIYEKDDDNKEKFILHKLYEDNLPTLSLDENQKRKVIKEEERYTGVFPCETCCSCMGAMGEAFCKVKRSCWCCCGCCMIALIVVFYTIGMTMYFVSEFHVANIATRDIYHLKYFNADNFTYYLDNVTGSEVLFDDEQYPNNVCSDLFSNCTTLEIELNWDKSFDNGEIEVEGFTEFQSLLVYLGVILFCFFAFIFETTFFYIVCTYTSRKMYERALKRIFNTSMSFFYSNPIGRIISRLSYDIVRLDYDFGSKFENNVTMLYVVCGIGLLAIGMTYGIYTVFIVIFVLVLLAVFFYFRKTALELKRLEAVSRSQVFHHYNQTLNGIATIKALELVDTFKKTNEYWINFHNRSYFLGNATMRILEEYMNIAASVGVFFTILLSIAFAYYVPWDESFGLMNMGITNLVTVVEIMCFMLTQFVEISLQSNSIERLDFYARYIKEEEKKTFNNGKEQRKILNIRCGRIEFKEFSMKYGEDFSNVLENIKFTILPGEKICIIGKTGCGKTSILLSLMRIVEAAEGFIDIDYQEIGICTKETVRKQISMIPQFAVLFQGTFRSNLDPFDEFEDNKIWEVLEKCSLRSTVEREGGLDGVIKTEGKNFSLGEKRLLCLARALLRENKIMLLDEATSISYGIDDLIQKVVTSLKNVTVMAITHRLDNIIHYDKIMVIDDGKIVEFDTLEKLLSDQSSFIFSLINLLPNKNSLLKLFNESIKSKKITV